MTYEEIHPEELGAPRGAAHGMLGPVGARFLFVSAQDASEPDGVVVETDLVEQYGIALGKAVTVVREAGGGPEDIGRITVFVVDLEEYRERRAEIRESYRAHVGRHAAPASVVHVAGFLDPGARVAVEVTALIQDFSGGGPAG